MDEALIEQASLTKKQYSACLDYMRLKGFHTEWAENERMLAGDQWPIATEDTKSLPRPVFNILEQILTAKVAAVMNENIKMVYSAEEIVADATKKALVDEAVDTINKWADHLWEQIGQDELNEEMLEDAGTNGPGYLHYYWDDDAVGGMEVSWKGDLKGEVLDAVNVFLGNPQRKKLSKQPYILVTHRELVEEVQQEARKNGVPEDQIVLIVPDKDTADEAYDMAQDEVNDAPKTTTIIKYRYNIQTGTVWLSKICHGVTVKPEVDMLLPIYPVVLMNWKRRKKSALGMGDIQYLKPNQKAINFLIAMMLLSVQETGWPKLVAKEKALAAAPLNKPGEVLIDRIATPGFWGVKTLESPAMSPYANILVEKFMEYTKETTGANENFLGERSTSDLNATAIMLLQQASGVPLKKIQRQFYRAIEEVGRIWEAFFKTKYNTQRNFVSEDEDGNNIPTTFTGTDYKDVKFSLKIDVGPSAGFNEALSMTSLDKLFDKGSIDLLTYLKYAPKNQIPFKDRLMKDLQEQMAQPMPGQGGMSLDQILPMLPPQAQEAFNMLSPEDKQIAIQRFAERTGQAPTMPMPQAV